MHDEARRRAELEAHRSDWGCTGENCEHYGCATVEKILDEWADAIAQAVKERDELQDQLNYIDSVSYLNGVRVTTRKLVETCAQQAEEIARLTKERDGFRELADDYWHQLTEINHERNTFRDEAARLRAALETAQVALDGCISAMSGFEGDGNRIVVGCSKDQFEADFNAAIAAERQAREALRQS